MKVKIRRAASPPPGTEKDFAANLNATADFTAALSISTPGEGELRSAVTQYGITLNFAANRYCAHYYPNLAGDNSSGDWAILDEGSGVTINSIGIAGTTYTTPTGTGSGVRNGFMINPVAGETHSFDGRAAGCVDFPTLPVTLYAGDSLVACVSRPNGDGSRVSEVTGDTVPLNEAYPDNSPKTMYAAVFTCVSSLPTLATFRPPYCGTNKPVFLTSDVNLALLPALASQSGDPLGIFGMKSAPGTWTAKYSNYYRKPQMFFCRAGSNSAEAMMPMHNQANYYGNVFCIESDALLWAATNSGDSSRNTLVYNIIQAAIDQYYAIQTNPNPVCRMNRCTSKGILVFAGHLLGNADIKCDATLRPTEKHNYKDPTYTASWFKTDFEPYDGTRWTGIENFCWRDDRHSNPDDQNPEDMKFMHISPSGSSDPAHFYDNGNGWCPIGVNRAWKANAYMWSVHDSIHTGTAIVMMKMGLRAAWGHDPYFKFARWWNTIDASSYWSVLDALSYSDPCGVGSEGRNHLGYAPPNPGTGWFHRQHWVALWADPAFQALWPTYV